VILQWGRHRATFLPQVWAQIPAPSAFMAALKRKAGLGEDFWASDVRLSRYRVTQHDGGLLSTVGQSRPGEARPAAAAATATPAAPARAPGLTFPGVLSGGFAFQTAVPPR
jgi:hypothetical protein